MWRRRSSRSVAASSPVLHVLRALLLPLLFLSAAVSPCAGQAAVRNLDDLRAAASSGGTYVVNANISLAGALSLNGTDTTLTLLGNTTACGGLCVLDAQQIGGHFVVSMGYTLTVDSLAFVNSMRGGSASEPCLGGIVRGSNIGDALTVSRNCAIGQLGSGYTSVSHLNDLPCGFLRCSSIIVAANASLFVANSLWANNTGIAAGQYGAMGAAISIVATAAAGFSIQHTQFFNNIVEETAGSFGNSGGAISIDQPFSAMVYPIAFKDAPDARKPDFSSFPTKPHIVELMQILNCTFMQNQAARGGALFLALNAGTVIVTGSTFERNVALGTRNWLSALGGAIYVHEYSNSRPFKALIGDYDYSLAPEENFPNTRFPLHPHYMFTDCHFLNNAARPKSLFLDKAIESVAAKGGAVAAQAGGYGISFDHCTFVGNSATNGGAMFYSGNSVTNDMFLFNQGIFNKSQVKAYNPAKDAFDYGLLDYAQLGDSSFAEDYLSLAPYAEETTYLLRIDSCAFSNNSATSGTAAATGGALQVDCGTAVISGSLFSANSIASTGTSYDALNSGGAVFATNDCLTADAANLLTTNVTVLNSTFVLNHASASGAAVSAMNHVYPGSGLQAGTIELVFVDSSFDTNVGTQLGGALYLDVTSHATLLRCNLTANGAVQGGAVYALGGAAQHTFSNSTFTSNVASMGGAVAAAGTAVLATNGCAYVANEAVNGSGVTVLTGAALYSNGDVYSRNAASLYGGAVFSTGNATLSGPTLSNNTAAVGAALFSAAAVQLLPSAVALGNGARNYGPVRATLPASYALFHSAGVALPLVGAVLSFQSGAALNFSLQMFDSYAQSVFFWPDLAVDVSCLSCELSSVIGTTNAAYFSRSAAFSSLAVSGSVGSTAVLGLKVVSPSIPLFGAAGVTVNISVTIAPCAPLEVFQNLRCICAPGTFLNGTSQQCQTCSPGSYSPAAGAVACTVNPPGFASSTQTTFASSVTLAGVSAARFGASQNATLTASIAATLGVPLSAIAIAAVTAPSATPAGRHLLQSSFYSSIAFSVSTSNGTQTSSLRSALNASAAFSGALTASLRSCADPVLSVVTGVVAAPPAETALVLAALPCPAGTFLNGFTQTCDQCQVGLVTTSTGSIACSRCPPRFAWASSSLCVSCPSNSVTSPNDVARCACELGFYDSRFGANLTAPVCLPCPMGGVCTSGYVGAADGYWRESTLSAFFYRCREGNCVEELVAGPLSHPSAKGTARRSLLQLTGNAYVPANCAHGNAGPLCALCLPGYSLQSGVCAPCDPKDAFDNWSSGSKGGLLVGCAVAGVIIIAFGLFQPLSPGLERIAEAGVAKAHSTKDALFACVTCACCRSKPATKTTADAAARAPQSSETVVVATARDEAVNHALSSNAAFGLGMAMAAADSGDDAESSGGDSEGGGAVEAALDFQDELEELLEKLQRYAKIVVKCVHPRARATRRTVWRSDTRAHCSLAARSFYQVCTHVVCHSLATLASCGAERPC